MKNLKLIIFGLAIVAGTFIWSCTPPDDENSFTIIISPEVDYAKVGDTVSVNVSVSTQLQNLNFVTFTATAADTNGTDTVLFEETVTASNGADLTSNFDFKVVKSLGTGTTITLNAKAVDNTDQSGELNGLVEVVTFMNLFRGDASMGHLWGPLNGSFNLVDGVEAYQADGGEVKDIADKSEQLKELSKVIIANTKTGTEFVDLGATFDISSAHTGNVLDLFGNRTATTTLTVAEGTKFLANLRGNDEFAIVHIKTIEPDYEQQPTQNKGRYIFDIYKTE